MDDATGTMDLVLISLFALVIWAVDKFMNKGDRDDKAPKEPPKGGRRFLWRFKGGNEKSEMKVWKSRDST